MSAERNSRQSSKHFGYVNGIFDQRQFFLSRKSLHEDVDAGITAFMFRLEQHTSGPLEIPISIIFSRCMFDLVADAWFEFSKFCE